MVNHEVAFMNSDNDEMLERIDRNAVRKRTVNEPVNDVAFWLSKPPEARYTKDGDVWIDPAKDNVQSYGEDG